MLSPTVPTSSCPGFLPVARHAWQLGMGADWERPVQFKDHELGALEPNLNWTSEFKPPPEKNSFGQLLSSISHCLAYLMSSGSDERTLASSVLTPLLGSIGYCPWPGSQGCNHITSREHRFIGNRTRCCLEEAWALNNIAQTAYVQVLFGEGEAEGGTIHELRLTSLNWPKSVFGLGLGLCQPLLTTFSSSLSLIWNNPEGKPLFVH